MAGVVDKDQNLRVTGSGGGGGNVTITAPLGSQPAAASVSVAIASDQLPLPVTLGAETTQGPLAWSNGVGGPTTINTPGPGTVILWLHGTATGNISVQEQFTSGGNFVNATGYVVPESTLSNPVQNYQQFSGQFGASLSTDFLAIVNTHGIAVKVTNGIATGSLSISIIFKSDDYNTKPVVLQGPTTGFAVDVTSRNELVVSLVAPSQQWVISTPIGDGIANPGSRAVPGVVDAVLVYNGTTFDKLRGDATNGAFVQVKSSIPIAVTGADGAILDGVNPTIKATVRSSKELAVTLLNHDGLLQKGDSLGGGNVLYPTPGEGGPLVGAIQLLNDVPNTVYTPAPGDGINGAFEQIKNFDTTTASAPTVWNSLTAIGSTIAVACAGKEEVIFDIAVTPSFSSGIIVAEGATDGGTLWAIIPSIIGGIGTLRPITNNIIVTSYLSSVSQAHIHVPTVGLTNVRLRLGAGIGGPGSLSITTNTTTVDGLWKSGSSLMLGLDTSGLATPISLAAPTDFSSNPSNIVPSISYLMGWDPGNSVWWKLNVDGATKRLLVDAAIGTTKIPSGGAFGSIVSANFSAIVTGISTGAGRGTITFKGTYTGVTVKLFAVNATVFTNNLIPLPIRNGSTGVVSSDTGVMSGNSTTDFFYEFEVPTGMDLQVTSTTYGSGQCDYVLLYDNLTTDIPVLPTGTPALVVNEGQPDYLSNSGQQSITQTKDGRLRVSVDEQIVGTLEILIQEVRDLKGLLAMALS